MRTTTMMSSSEVKKCLHPTAYRFLEDGRSPKIEVLDELIKWLDLKVVRR